MSNKITKTRLYIDMELKAGAVQLVTGNQGHYLVNVMRLKMGEYVAVFNGHAGEWLAEVTKTGKGKANITVREKIAEQKNESDLWYLFAPIKKARIEYMMQTKQFDRQALTALGVDEEQTEASLDSLYQKGYISEPHAAVAYHGLNQSIDAEETGIFLGTAHPAKFKSTVEEVLNIDLSLPKEIAQCVTNTDLSHQMAADFKLLETFLYRL
jgi:threonine synthase